LLFFDHLNGHKRYSDVAPKLTTNLYKAPSCDALTPKLSLIDETFFSRLPPRDAQRRPALTIFVRANPQPGVTVKYLQLQRIRAGAEVPSRVLILAATQPFWTNSLCAVCASNSKAMLQQCNSTLENEARTSVVVKSD
jgi:hypothetical protein